MYTGKYRSLLFLQNLQPPEQGNKIFIRFLLKIFPDFPPRKLAFPQTYKSAS